MGQRRINHEQTPGRFPEGTLKRIDAVLKPGESRAEFLRQAVEALLRKREGEVGSPDVPRSSKRLT